MHDASVGQVIDGLDHAVHVMLDFCQVHVVEVRKERLALLVSEHQAHLAVEAVALDQLGYIVFAALEFLWSVFEK